MKSKLSKGFILFWFLFEIGCVKAQFSDSFTIFFTKSINVHNQLPKESWAEEVKKSIPKIKKDQYLLIGKQGVSTFKLVPNPDEKSELPEWLLPSGGSDVIQFPDSFKIRKDIMGLNFLVSDSNLHFKWKITNDKRTIAGYNCRKAIAKFQDSILIYAFYAEELIGSQGPEIIQGLPGVILGLGIPAFHTVWFADKVVLNANGFQPLMKPKKKEKRYTMITMHKEMEKLFGGRWTADAEKMFWKLFF